MIENNNLTHLQKTVEKQFGKKISTATDCVYLSEAVKEKLSVKISPQTLRRFFNLIKSNSGCSLFTLNLLARYCGFQDFKTFNESYSCSELEIFFSGKENDQKDFWQKSDQLCKQITESPELLVSTHHQLMSFPLVRKFFMEHHPLRDLMATVYSQYFLEYLKYNTNNQARIFAYGFLFKSAFLAQNEELMDLYYKKVQETELTEDFHVIPAGLKYGVQLLYADFTGNEYLFRKYFAEMKKVRLEYVNASEKSVCSFEYTVLESLIFTNRTSEMKFLIDNNTFQKYDDLIFIPSQRKQTHEEAWKILCATYYQKINNQQKADHYFDMVNLENLENGWRKYYSILYYFFQLKASENDHRKETILKIKALINETYFSYYDQLLSDFLEHEDSVRMRHNVSKKLQNLSTN